MTIEAVSGQKNIGDIPIFNRTMVQQYTTDNFDHFPDDAMPTNDGLFNGCLLRNLG